MYKLYKVKLTGANSSLYRYRLHDVKKDCFSYLYLKDELMYSLEVTKNALVGDQLRALLQRGKLPEHYTLVAEWNHKPTKTTYKQTLPELFI